MKTRRPTSTRPLCDFDNRQRKKRGVTLLGGLDEAGRGPLAGPVVAACVVLAPATRLPGVADSKLLAPETREALVPLILERSVAWGVGWTTAHRIDAINILQGTLEAAAQACAALATPPEFLLTDFLKPPAPPCRYEPLVDGDARSQAIAAASVLAKVARDRIMAALDGEYPHYSFASNKGYATPAHWAALNEHGPSTLHRLSFRGVCGQSFFENAPPRPIVRCRGAARLAPVAPPRHVDWRYVLTCEPGALAAEPFLPEWEWLMNQVETA